MHVTRNPRPLESKLYGLSRALLHPGPREAAPREGAEHTSEGTAHTHQTRFHGILRILCHTICLIAEGVTFFSFSIMCVFYKWTNLVDATT